MRRSQSLNSLEDAAMRTMPFDPVSMRQARLGRDLRAIYDGVTESPLPDHLASLLHQLDTLSPSR